MLKISKEVRNALVIGFYTLTATLLTHPNLPSGNEIYIAVLVSLMALLTELAQKYGILNKEVVKSVKKSKKASTTFFF